MIHHLSIAARDPERVARVVAELWRGGAMPFPPVASGSWVAASFDERGTTMEVYPLGVELHPVEGDADAEARMNAAMPAHTATHAAIATPLSEAEVHALADREGWLAKYRKRGGRFGVIEFWLENSVLIEVLTAEMQAEYLAATRPETYRAIMAQVAARRS